MTRDDVFTHAQLLSTGLTDREVRQRLRAGQLTRPRRGIYHASGPQNAVDEHRLLILSALPFVHDSNVISHQSAGVIHGLPVPSDGLSLVTMTRLTAGHGKGSPLLRVRQTAIDPDEYEDRAGLRITTLARTAADLARTMPFEWAVAALDAALAAGLERAELVSALNRHPRLAGLGIARRALSFADGRAESPAESISRVQFARFGVPAPVVQFEVVDADGSVVARADFGWPELGLVGEVDGKWKYGELLKPGQSPEEAIMREKRREEAIRQAGFWIVRWDWATAVKGAALARLIRSAMVTPARRSHP